MLFYRMNTVKFNQQMHDDQSTQHWPGRTKVSTTKLSKYPLRNSRIISTSILPFEKLIEIIVSVECSLFTRTLIFFW